MAQDIDLRDRRAREKGLERQRRWKGLREGAELGVKAELESQAEDRGGDNSGA